MHEYTHKRNLIINYDISFEGGIRPTGNIRRGKGNETQTVIFSIYYLLYSMNGGPKLLF